MAGPRVLQQPARETLHRDIAHPGGPALVGQSQIALAGDVAEGELHRLKQTRGDALLGHADAVRRHADMIDPAAAFGLARAGKGAVRIVGVGHLGHVVELEQVDMIGAQHLQAVLDMLQHAFAVARLALGREHDLIAHVRERETDLFFAVGVGVGRVKVADAAVIRGLQQMHGVILFAALQRQTAHRGLGDEQARRAEGDLFHGVLLPFFLPDALIIAKTAAACKAPRG